MDVPGARPGEGTSLVSGPLQFHLQLHSLRHMLGVNHHVVVVETARRIGIGLPDDLNPLKQQMRRGVSHVARMLLSFNPHLTVREDAEPHRVRMQPLLSAVRTRRGQSTTKRLQDRFFFVFNFCNGQLNLPIISNLDLITLNH